MINNILDSITDKKLSEIETVNGNVMHVLKENEDAFIRFGEAYFSWIKPQSIKGWKKHNKMTMNLVVPVGNVKFVFFNSSLDIKKEYIIGVDNYVRITVPPKIWFGFKGLGQENNLVLNISSILHDSKEVETKELDQIEYNWE
tara:strand:- start:614 stop:1042 length:429 start_codon:yes stop_codon:yes gene_type:complete